MAIIHPGETLSDAHKRFNQGNNQPTVPCNSPYVKEKVDAFLRTKQPPVRAER